MIQKKIQKKQKRAQTKASKDELVHNEKINSSSK